MRKRKKRLTMDDLTPEQMAGAMFMDTLTKHPKLFSFGMTRISPVVHVICHKKYRDWLNPLDNLNFVIQQGWKMREAYRREGPQMTSTLWELPDQEEIADMCIKWGENMHGELMVMLWPVSWMAEHYLLNIHPKDEDLERAVREISPGISDDDVAGCVKECKKRNRG